MISYDQRFLTDIRQKYSKPFNTYLFSNNQANRRPKIKFPLCFPWGLRPSSSLQLYAISGAKRANKLMTGKFLSPSLHTSELYYVHTSQGDRTTQQGSVVVGCRLQLMSFEIPLPSRSLSSYNNKYSLLVFYRRRATSERARGWIPLPILSPPRCN